MDRIQMISTHGFLAAATFLVGGSVPAEDFPNRWNPASVAGEVLAASIGDVTEPPGAPVIAL